MQRGEQVYDHGRYDVVVTFTNNYYEAETDGRGRPIPFFINSAEDGVVNVKAEDGSAYVDKTITIGTNPDKYIGISDLGALSTSLVASYPFKPATTTILTTE